MRRPASLGMVFTSQIFLFYFLTLVLAGYYALPVRARNPFLTFVSYVFYGWWSPWFVLLMLGSTCVDWFCGKAVSAPGASVRKRKGAVLVSVVCNLSLLGFFKYFGFAAENVDRIVRAVGGEGFEVLRIALPVGISFYTFQSMSYCIDLYRGHAKPARSFFDFACYVSMFPQLVAGPIVRFRDMAEQLRGRPQRGERFREGVLYFMLGFAKKVLIANPLGEVADLTFSAGSMTFDVAWFGLIAYAFQIYFDFSGYSDMAIGLGAMLGFELPVNFRSPYRSRSITEFWQRWHVSLSTWLRDYLYIPLGGNRLGKLLTYRNLMLTMLLGGLWHGAAWTFLIWGLWHGALLAFERMNGREQVYDWLPERLRTVVTFVLVTLAWVPFRADGLGEAVTYLGALFGAIGDPGAASVLSDRVYTPYYGVVFGIAAGCVWWGRETRDLVAGALESKPSFGWASSAVFVLAVAFMFLQAENPFLYFQF